MHAALITAYHTVCEVPGEADLYVKIQEIALVTTIYQHTLSKRLHEPYTKKP